MADETSEPLSDNAALNEIVDTLEDILQVEEGAYDTVSGSTVLTAIADTLTTIRTADDTALKTVISNGGSDGIEVYEDGVLAMLVPPGESKVLSLTGKGLIKAKCATGDNSFYAIATYRKTVT